MKSPFAIFRKHQKVLMVVLTGLAMFAFIVLDSLSQNMEAFPPIFGLVVGLGIAWGLTRKSGHSWAWMLVGAAAGAYLGSQLQQSSTAAQTVVSTSFGALTESDLQEVHNRRQIVNGFLIEAFRRAHEGEENPPQFQLQGALFGGNGDPQQEALMHLLLTKEAQQMGLAVSREQVKAHIDQATSNKLSGRAFAQIVSRMGVSGDELFSLMGEQLQARQARQILMPASLVTPEDYWDAYRKLNVRQEMALVPLAVEAFNSLVGDPSDQELQQLFEEYKDKYPNQSKPGAPGFRQPGRIKLGYLEIDYDTIEKTIPEITDEEILKKAEERLAKREAEMF